MMCGTVNTSSLSVKSIAALCPLPLSHGVNFFLSLDHKLGRFLAAAAAAAGASRSPTGPFTMPSGSMALADSSTSSSTLSGTNCSSANSYNTQERRRGVSLRHPLISSICCD
jgi:hypothetical protein